MITSAREAREILKCSDEEFGGVGESKERRVEAKGYLACLEGQEVKALVTVLNLSSTDHQHPANPVCIGCLKVKALDQYYEALKSDHGAKEKKGEIK